MHRRARRRQMSRAADARAQWSLSTEARRGQMVRGGRSWPPDSKAGMARESAGQKADVVGTLACTEGGANANGVKQQPLAQTWQAVGWPSETDVSPSEASPSEGWGCAVACAACKPCTAGIATWTCSTAAAELGPDPPPWHSMAVANAPRMGSNKANRTRITTRRFFTWEDYRFTVQCSQRIRSSLGRARRLTPGRGVRHELHGAGWRMPPTTRCLRPPDRPGSGTPADRPRDSNARGVPAPTSSPTAPLPSAPVP